MATLLITLGYWDWDEFRGWWATWLVRLNLLARVILSNVKKMFLLNGLPYSFMGLRLCAAHMELRFKDRTRRKAAAVNDFQPPE